MMKYLGKIIPMAVLLCLVFEPLAVLAVKNTTIISVDVTSETPAPHYIVSETSISSLYISELIVSKLQADSATVLWNTNRSAQCKFFIGNTSETGTETISEIIYKENHFANITGLLPQTLYYFQITCEDHENYHADSGKQQFITLALPDTTPPPNVSDLTATPSDQKITLNWINPKASDFFGVRILRSTKFFPISLSDGETIFDGNATTFVDTGLTNGAKYYYTVFSYDSSGNFSSGAIVYSSPLGFEVKIPPEPELPPEEIAPPEEVPAEIGKLTLDDFNFVSGGKNIVKDGHLEADPESVIEVSLNYDKVPEVLKTIMITLEKDGKNFSFLLKVNAEKTGYGAAFLVPKEPGKYRMTITIIDYKNRVIKKIKCEFLINGPSQTLEKKEISVFSILIKQFNQRNFLIFALLILFILLIFLIKRRWRPKRRSEKKGSKYSE